MKIFQLLKLKIRNNLGKPFSKLTCVVIQNNFELPQTRVIGNSAFYLENGNINFINKLNLFISEATKNIIIYILMTSTIYLRLLDQKNGMIMNYGLTINMLCHLKE